MISSNDSDAMVERLTTKVTPALRLTLFSCAMRPSDRRSVRPDRGRRSRRERHHVLLGELERDDAAAAKRQVSGSREKPPDSATAVGPALKLAEPEPTWRVRPSGGGGGNDVDGRGRDRVDEVRAPDGPACQLVHDRAGDSGRQHVDGVAVRVGRDLGRRADDGRRRSGPSGLPPAYDPGPPSNRLVPSGFFLFVCSPPPRRSRRAFVVAIGIGFDRRAPVARPRPPKPARHHAGRGHDRDRREAESEASVYLWRCAAGTSVASTATFDRGSSAHSALLDGVDVGFAGPGGLVAVASSGAPRRPRWNGGTCVQAAPERARIESSKSAVDVFMACTRSCAW